MRSKLAPYSMSFNSLDRNPIYLYFADRADFLNVCNENCITGERFFVFFSVRILSVLRGHSVFSSPPQRPMTSDFEGFPIRDFIHYIYFPILILEKEPVFSLLNVQC